MNKFQRSQSRKRHFWWENKGFPVDFPNHYQSIHCAQVLSVESFRASAVVRPCHAGDHQGSGAAADRIFWGPPWLKWRPREERATRGLWMPGLQGAVRYLEPSRVVKLAIGLVTGRRASPPLSEVGGHRRHFHRDADLYLGRGVEV